MSDSTDVLIFVEDAGAANYVSPLPEALQNQGLTVRLLATGAASAQLEVLGVQFQFLPLEISAERVVSQYRPRLILVGTSENLDTLGLELVVRGKACRIPTVGVVDGAANAGFRFRGRGNSALTYAPDWLFVPDEGVYSNYGELKFPRSQIKVCGHPHYDRVVRERARFSAVGRDFLRREMFPSASPERPILLFATELSDGLDPTQFVRSESYTLAGRGTSEMRTEIVLEEVLDAAKEMSPRPYLVLRLHPNEDAEAYRMYSDEIDTFSEGGSSLEAIFASDLVIGMTSILLIEAILLYKTTISIVPREMERAWLSSVGPGITPCVTTRGEIVPEILRALGSSGPDPRNVDAVFPLGSTSNVVANVLHVLKETGHTFTSTGPSHSLVGQ